jgi:hypothetical protein
VPIIIDGTGTISGVSATGLTTVQNLPATGTITNLTSTTATVTTLNAPSGVLATQNGMTGIAKAWINFDATTSTIRGSFNVASITKIGTGRFTITFTTAMPNANYCVTGIGADINQSLAGDIGLFGSTAPSTTAVNVGGVVNGSTYYDFPYMMFSIDCS